MEALVDPFGDDQQSVPADFLLVQRLIDFITTISKINLVRHWHSIAMNVAHGSSKDELARFKISCPISGHGYTKMFE